MLKVPYWPTAHRFLVQHKKTINGIFSIATIVGFLFIALGFYSFENNTALYTLGYEVGESLGTLALFLFVGTLIPGILSRFKVFPLVAASIVLFRRQMGILMFTLALIHSFYLSTIPAIMSGDVGIEFLSTGELYGSIALSTLLPVWLTSNDLSQRKFGKTWKTIQRITYLTMFAIFLHIAVVSDEVLQQLIALAIIVLEICSWVKVWFFAKK